MPIRPASRASRAKAEHDGADLEEGKRSFGAAGGEHRSRTRSRSAGAISSRIRSSPSIVPTHTSDVARPQPKVGSRRRKGRVLADHGDDRDAGLGAELAVADRGADAGEPARWSSHSIARPSISCCTAEPPVDLAGAEQLGERAGVGCGQATCIEHESGSTASYTTISRRPSWWTSTPTSRPSSVVKSCLTPTPGSLVSLTSVIAQSAASDARSPARVCGTPGSRLAPATTLTPCLR